jgi:hypothetical protein
MVRAKSAVGEVNGKVNNVDEQWDLPSVSVPEKKITFISRTKKETSTIIDAFRIISWQQFKSEYKVKGLEGYQEFYEAWTVHEIHQMSLNELKELYSDLGYSLSDLVKIRNDYYKYRRDSKSVLQESVLQESDSFSDDEPAF